ncbi:MAG TPA: sugar phosphate isomerase/epimerase family protein [Tepidisphaeraceae bacterium]|nr:sugar phosphate isomerase/epimerase family protein [Tepidisphaeraceae bacterium]
MRSAVTISLIKEARGGPFIYWDDLPGSIRKAASLGFDAVEIFPPAGDAIPADQILPLLKESKLKVSAIGTGGGWVLHKLTLTNADADIRRRATEFIRSIIDAAGALGAPAIVGSMQGRWCEAVGQDLAMHYLQSALNDLGEHAKKYNVPLIYEPLNRYETNIINTLGQGAALLSNLKTTNVKLLADLFHLNIEEANIAESIRHAAAAIGHVHLADSNRRPATLGHTDFASIAQALAEISYGGYVSAECLPYPDSDAAAESTIKAFNRFFAPLTPIGPH